MSTHTVLVISKGTWSLTMSTEGSNLLLANWKFACPAKVGKGDCTAHVGNLEKKAVKILSKSREAIQGIAATGFSTPTALKSNC